jgi:hypothetical protein
MPSMGCLHNQIPRFGSFSLGIFLFALDVYLTRRNFAAEMRGWGILWLEMLKYGIGFEGYGSTVGRSGG